jgi:hypothetical protein
MRIGLHIKYWLFLSDFNETGIFSTDFRKMFKIVFHENTSSGNRLVHCGKTDGRTDMTKLIVAFSHFGNAPKNKFLYTTKKFWQLCITFTILKIYRNNVHSSSGSLFSSFAIKLVTSVTSRYWQLECLMSADFTKMYIQLHFWLKLDTNNKYFTRQHTKW